NRFVTPPRIDALFDPPLSRGLLGLIFRKFKLLSEPY
ncbi:MAG: hypothetical protein ACI9TO_001155, partial [Rickettsiales bacterium]